MGQPSRSLSTVVERVAAYERVAPEELLSLADHVSPDIYTYLTTAWTEQTDPIEFTYVCWSR